MVNEAAKTKVDDASKKISGETIVGESGGSEQDVSGSMYDDSFVDINLDNDPISNEQMQNWMDRL